MKIKCSNCGNITNSSFTRCSVCGVPIAEKNSWLIGHHQDNIKHLIDLGKRIR